MSDVIWDKSSNPTPYVSKRLGVEEWQLRKAIHAIKKRGGLYGADRVIIHADGKVTDEGGEDIGNVHDEI